MQQYEGREIIKKKTHTHKIKKMYHSIPPIVNTTIEYKKKAGAEEEEEKENRLKGFYPLEERACS